jgi:hypothetical protein
MAVLTLTAASMPATVGPLAGVADGGNSNGDNSVSYVSSNGAGAGDTIANAELVKGLSTNSRLYAFLNFNFQSQADLEAAQAALGINVSVVGGSVFRFITAGPGKPTATLTGVAATPAIIRISAAHSMTR